MRRDDIRMKTEVVVHRRRMNGNDLKRMEENGLSLDVSEERNCELKINGLAVGRGHIVKKRGEFYFKVTGMYEGDENV